MIDPIRVVRGDPADIAPLRLRLQRPVQIRLSDPTSSDEQILTVALVELLRRLLANVDVDVGVDVASTAELPPGPPTLAERIEQASSYGWQSEVDDSVVPDGESGDQSPLVVSIGPGPDADASLHVYGAGWISYVGTEPPATCSIDEGSNPIGPLSAACRATGFVLGEIVGDLVDHVAPPTSSWWDDLTHLSSAAPIPPDRDAAPLNAPELDALLMGCGSIGGAVAYVLARVPDLKGHLDLLDPERLEARNQAKAILARPDAVGNAEEKATVAADELAHHQALSVGAHVTTLAAYVAARKPEDALPLVMCAVDSIASRRELQDCLPLEVINAACGAGDVAVSSHVTDDGPCVYCLYISQVLDRDLALVQILARETGMPEAQVGELIVSKAPLELNHLRLIEIRRELSSGSLDAYRGHTLEDLYAAEILYGEHSVELNGAKTAIPAPHTTALAGVLLAAELLKASSAELVTFQLGPRGELDAQKYQEVLGQAGGMTSNPPRHPGLECLCNDERRLSLMHARYHR